MPSIPTPVSGLLYSGGKLIRPDGRPSTELRPVEIIPQFINSAEGSALLQKRRPNSGLRPKSQADSARCPPIASSRANKAHRARLVVKEPMSIVHRRAKLFLSRRRGRRAFAGEPKITRKTSERKDAP